MNIIEIIKQFFKNLRKKPQGLLEDFSKRNEKDNIINQIISQQDDDIEQSQQNEPNEDLQEETQQQEQQPSDISEDDIEQSQQNEPNKDLQEETQQQEQQPNDISEDDIEQTQQNEPNKDLQEKTQQQEQQPSDISDDDIEQSQPMQQNEDLQEETQQQEQQPNDISEDDIEQSQPMQQNEDLQEETQQQEQQPSDISDDDIEQSQQRQQNEDLQEETQQQEQQPSDISDDDNIEQPQQEENIEGDDFFDKLNDNYDRKKNLENQIHKAINSEGQTLDNRIMENIIRKLIQEDPFEKIRGYQRIDKKQLARHLSLDLPHKILDDKYAAKKKPISFYFDFSESNNNSIFMYAKILTKLMKKDISLYLGYNDLTCKRIQVKRDNTKKSDISYLLTLEENDISSIPLGYNVNIFQVPIKIEELVEKDKIKKIVVFSDYDAADSIVEASRKCEVIWLCTERNNRGSYFKDINEHPSNRYKLKDFKGVFIKLDSPKKILEYLNNYGRSEYERKNRREQLEGDSR